MKTLVKLLSKKGIKYYNTDKGTYHNYLIYYDKLFLPFRNKKINIFEVGFYLGGSCKLWEDYFTKAKIKFIDIDSNCILESTSGRASLDIMDVMNLTTDYFDTFPPDIAIDDGSHTIESQIHFIEVTYPALRSGGLLIVEDVYLEKYGLLEFDKINIPYEIIDRRTEQSRVDEVLLIFRK